MASVELRDVRKSFGDFEAVHGVSLRVEDGEFVVFVGPSGCGKSTLLRLIAGLDEASSGDIWIDQDIVNDMAPVERGVAMVFQSYALYPHMTVFENMAFGLTLAGTPRSQIEERVGHAAGILELSSLLSRKPRELSGGQRQRVAIGRAIVREPRVFLFDEPLSNLDAKLRVQTRIEVAKLHNSLDSTMIYVTHDQVEAMTLADRIVVLNAGIVEQIGRPMDLYRRPVNRFVAGFLGSPQMNFLSGRTVLDNGAAALCLPDESTIALPPDSGAASRTGESLTLGIRPEHLAAEPDRDVSLAGRIMLTEQLGDHSLVHVVLPHGEDIVMKVEGETRARADENIVFGANFGDCHMFGEDGRAMAGDG